MRSLNVILSTVGDSSDVLVKNKVWTVLPVKIPWNFLFNEQRLFIDSLHIYGRYIFFIMGHNTKCLLRWYCIKHFYIEKLKVPIRIILG